MKRFELLAALPAYGPMYVPMSLNGAPFFAEGLAVRFFRCDGSDWVGNFQPGTTSCNTVLEPAQSNCLFVIAGGACYLVNPELEKALEVFGGGFSAVHAASEGRLVLQGESSLCILEADGRYWFTERISWDGFKDLQVAGDTVSGLSFDPTNAVDEWVPFTYHLVTRTLAGGSYRRGM